MTAAILTVVNHKGGVGKTTTCLNLTVALAMAGHRVLAIDLDPQAHLTESLQVEGDDLPAERTIAAVFERGGTLAEIIVPTRETNLKAVPSSIRLAPASERFHSMYFREGKIKEALRAVMEDFDYVVFDTAPNLGVLTINSLVAADRVLIPTSNSRYSLHGLSDLIDVMESAKRESTDYDWRILRTMLSGHAHQRNQLAAKLLAPLSARLLQTQIRRTEAVERSQFRDDETLSAVVLDRRASNRGAQDYRELMKEILTLWPAG